MVKELIIVYRYIYKASKKNQLLLLLEKRLHWENPECNKWAEYDFGFKNNNVDTILALYEFSPGTIHTTSFNRRNRYWAPICAELVIWWLGGRDVLDGLE